MLFTETMMTLDDAAALLPGGRSKTTLYRWCTKGYRGVKLECRWVGNCIYTSPDALERFTARLAEAGAATADETVSDSAPVVRVPTRSRLEHKVSRSGFDARSILERAGIVSLSPG